MSRIKIICGTCSSENVSRDGAARWCVDSQQWELSTVYDSADCHDCGTERRLAELPIDPPKEKSL